MAPSSKPVMRLAIVLGVLPQEMGRQQRNILAPVAQRRQADLDGVQAEQQILPEAPLRHRDAQVGIGGREDAHIHAPRLGRADALELAGLEVRSSLDCSPCEMLAISSRNSVPPSAISKRPTRSLLASVNAPFTWPNSSLSKTPSARPPVFTVTSGRVERSETECSVCATSPLPVPFSPVISTLASDGPTREITSSTGRMAADLRDQLRKALGAQRAVLGFQPLPLAQRAAQLDLRLQNGGEPRVVPGLLNEIARAAAHSLHRQFHRAPRGHHDHRQRGIERLDAIQQLQPFLPGGGVARVIEVHQHRVEVARFHGVDGRGGRIDGFGLVAFALDQEAKRLQHIGLVVRDQDAGRTGIG